MTHDRSSRKRCFLAPSSDKLLYFWLCSTGISFQPRVSFGNCKEKPSLQMEYDNLTFQMQSEYSYQFQDGCFLKILIPNTPPTPPPPKKNKKKKVFSRIPQELRGDFQEPAPLVFSFFFFNPPQEVVAESPRDVVETEGLGI